MSDQPPGTESSRLEPSPWDPAAWVRDMRLATGFFTRLPVSTPSGSLGEAARAFPIAGLAVGAIGAAVYLLAFELGLSGLLAALLALSATVIATGALHEDGLADFADMLGVRGDRDRKLSIMRDSRIGSFGTLALGLTAAIKVAAIIDLGAPGAVAGALIAAHVSARATLPLVMRSLPLAKSSGLAADSGRPSASGTRWALVLALIISALACSPICAIVALISAIAAAFIVAEVARRQIGGYTGDVLGAAEQFAELAILVNIVTLS